MKSVFDSISREASEIDEILSNPYNDLESLQKNFGVGIWSFFEVLHELFGTLGLLTDNIKKEENKFRFINAYPDQTYDDSNIITYDVTRRVPLKVDSKAIPGSTTYIKPTYIKELYNPISGNTEQLYSCAFNNTISLTVFSNKSRTLNNMVRLIESVFIRYSSHIKKHIYEFVLIGMNSIQFTDRYDEKDRIFSREIQFNIITLEYFILELEQLKSIDLTIEN